MANEMEEFYEMQISDGLHQKVKDIMKKNMTKKEVHILLNWHCDINRSDDEFKLVQLVTLKRMGKVN